MLRKAIGVGLIALVAVNALLILNAHDRDREAAQGAAQARAEAASAKIWGLREAPPAWQSDASEPVSVASGFDPYAEIHRRRVEAAKAGRPWWAWWRPAPESLEDIPPR